MLWIQTLVSGSFLVCTNNPAVLDISTFTFLKSTLKVITASTNGERKHFINTAKSVTASTMWLPLSVCIDSLRSLFSGKIAEWHCDYNIERVFANRVPSWPLRHLHLTRFNQIAIQARAQMAADKEAVGLSRVHMYESKRIPPLRNKCIFYS